MERIRLFVGKIRIARIAGIARNRRHAAGSSHVPPVIPTGARGKCCPFKKSLAGSGEIPRGVS